MDARHPLLGRLGDRQEERRRLPAEGPAGRLVDHPPFLDRGRGLRQRQPGERRLEGAEAAFGLRREEAQQALALGRGVVVAGDEEDAVEMKPLAGEDHQRHHLLQEAEARVALAGEAEGARR